MTEHTPEVLSEAQLDAVATACGRHTDLSSNPPTDKRARELWGLMEILDFECYRYGDAPKGITVEQVKAYLLAHKEEARTTKMEPTSYLGLVAGVFDFLCEPQKGAA